MENLYLNRDITPIVYTNNEGIECVEEFRDIFEGDSKYQVSNLGRVKSNIRNSPIILKQTKRENGRLCVGIKTTQQVTMSVHRLVTTAFIPNPDNKCCVNHIDGVPQNNKLSNLEWCTQSENMQHAVDTGLKTQPSEKIDMLSVDGEFIRTFSSAFGAADFIKGDKGKIYNCCNGKMVKFKGFQWRYTSKTNKIPHPTHYKKVSKEDLLSFLKTNDAHNMWTYKTLSQKLNTSVYQIQKHLKVLKEEEKVYYFSDFKGSGWRVNKNNTNNGK